VTLGNEADVAATLRKIKEFEGLFSTILNSLNLDGGGAIDLCRLLEVSIAEDRRTVSVGL
jgi:hypothetical protein